MSFAEVFHCTLVFMLTDPVPAKGIQLKVAIQDSQACKGLDGLFQCGTATGM